MSRRTRAYGLTARQLDVLALLLAGYSHRQIAEALCIAIDTSRAHSAAIYARLSYLTDDAHFDRRALYAWAFCEGLITLHVGAWMVRPECATE